jgi:hypothetical protein
VGNYISYDKREAVSYARALAKTRERERKAAEEKAIWDALALEQIEADRRRTAAKPPKPPRQPKPKPEPMTTYERALQALERACVARNKEADREVTFLTEHCLDYRRSDCTGKLVTKLTNARWVGRLDTDYYSSKVWVDSAVTLLKKSENESMKEYDAAALFAPLFLAMRRVPKAARDILRTAHPNVRREVAAGMRIWHKYHMHDKWGWPLPNEIPVKRKTRITDGKVTFRIN